MPSVVRIVRLQFGGPTARFTRLGVAQCTVPLEETCVRPGAEGVRRALCIDAANEIHAISPSFFAATLSSAWH